MMLAQGPPKANGPGTGRPARHSGGRSAKVRLSAGSRKTALAAARVLGLRVAGVDLLESAEGPMVMEVNSSPGLEGIQKTTAVDVAAAIIEFIERDAAPPRKPLKD
jgi:ribosomal protein S6--L-glutamate ligase